MTKEEQRQAVVFAAIFEYTQQRFTVEDGKSWPRVSSVEPLKEKYWREVLGPDWRGPHPPHWCGAFALWCLRQARLCDWIWEVKGINGAEHFGFLWQLELTPDPEPGDVAYYVKNQHHAIVEKVVPGMPGEGDDPGTRATVWTIDGNQPAIDRHGPEDARAPKLLYAPGTSYYSIASLLTGEP